MAWGLEIQPDRLRLCRATRTRDRLRIARQAEVPVPPGLVQPSLSAPNLPDGPALAALLARLARDLGCRGWVHAALPDEVFALRSVVTEALPADRSEATRYLRWQARELLPFPAEEARLDFLPGPRQADGRRRIACLLARERVLAEYERLLSEARLEAARVDAGTITLAQALSARLGQRTAVLLAFGPRRLTLLVLEDDCPRFWRTLKIAEPMAEADRQQLLREVADSLAFCRQSEGVGAVEELLLDGPEELTSGLATELTEWLEIPVSAARAAADLQPTGAGAAAARWGAAIGAAVAPW
jgi:Tfp pilus assembly PilM family ATPase